MDFETDNAAVAWGHWLAQFGESPKLEAMVKSLYKGMDSAAKVAAELYMDRWLDTARGVRLDGIGEIVGQDREILAGSVPFFGFLGQSHSAGFGGARFRREGETDTSGKVALLDAEYRQVIRWKIAVNKGSGTARDIAEALNAVFNTTGTNVRDDGNANITVLVDVRIDLDNPLIVNKDKWVPSAAGVGFHFAGFRQKEQLLTEDGDDLLTEDGNQLIAEYYEEGQ